MSNCEHDTEAEDTTITFEQEFLAQFHQRLLNLCESRSVEIMQVQQKESYQIYTFKKQKDIVVLKFGTMQNNAFSLPSRTKAVFFNAICPRN
jgi:hypothetical protein